MWPLERLSQWRIGGSARQCDVLRIGVASVERWTETSSGMTLAAQQPIAMNLGPSVGRLIEALRTMYGPAAIPSKATLVLESAWLPMLLVDTGGKLWSATQAESLLKHRFGLVYGDAGTVSAWEVRTDHRPGDRFALGFGMPQDLKQALLEFGAELQIAFDAIEPAFEWARSLVQRHSPDSRRAAWWVWGEQDRMIIAGLDAGRVVALNPAAARSADPVALLRLIQAEGIRWGMSATDGPVTSTTWATAVEGRSRNSARSGATTTLQRQSMKTSP